MALRLACIAVYEPATIRTCTGKQLQGVVTGSCFPVVLLGCPLQNAAVLLMPGAVVLLCF